MFSNRVMTLFALLLLSQLAPVNAVSFLNAPAVAPNGTGILTKMEGSAIPCSSKCVNGVFVDIQPFISEDTQNSAKIATMVAANLAGVNADDYAVLFKVNTNVQAIDGPSGGMAFTLLAYSEFTGKKIREDLSVTGTIQEDGSVGKIGGVIQKIQAASGNGIKLFLLPKGQSLEEGIDLVSFARDKYKMQVIEVPTMSEAVKYAFTDSGTVIPNAPTTALTPLRVDKIEDKLLAASKPLISITSSEIQKGMNELNSSPLSNNPDASRIITSMNNNLQNSKYLLDNGYYYSSANNAFITRINIETLLSAGMKAGELNGKVIEMDKETTLMTFTKLNSQNLEWLSAAKLRYYWASNKIQDLKSKLAVINDANANVAPDLITEYFTASSWLSAASKLNDIALTLNGNDVNELSARKAALEEIQAAESSIKKLNASGLQADSESNWELSVSQDEFSQGEYATSALNAAFAKAYADSILETNGKKGLAISGLLEPTAPFYAGESHSSSAWGQAYFVHSLYSIQQANYSGDAGFLLDAVKLQLLSNEWEHELSQLKNSFSSPFSPEQTKNPVLTSQQMQVVVTPPPNFAPLSLRNLVIWGIALIAVIILAIAVYFVSHKRTVIPPSVSQVEDRIDRMLLEGKISEKTYEHLRKKYGTSFPKKKAPRK